MLRAAYANAGVRPQQVRLRRGARHRHPRRRSGRARRARRRPRGRATSRRARCLVGSVKTNIGHTEGAAGMAGLIKCVLALQHGEVPPSLHLKEPNPAIPWGDLPFDVPQARVPWPSGADTPRVAGVSAFGIAGTNAHVVLEEAPAPPRRHLPARTSRCPSCSRRRRRRPPGARRRVRRAARRGRRRGRVRDVCATAARHRAALEHRAVFVAGATDAPGERVDLVDRLRRFAAGETPAADAVGRARTDARRVAFVFPGQGGQWLGMARELLEEEPEVRASIERVRPRPPRRPWLDRERAARRSDRTHPATGWTRSTSSSPCCWRWRSPSPRCGGPGASRPDAVVGHSMGEVGAAYLAGVLSPRGRDAGHLRPQRAAAAHERWWRHGGPGAVHRGGHEPHRSRRRPPLRGGQQRATFDGRLRRSRRGRRGPRRAASARGSSPGP